MGQSDNPSTETLRYNIPRLSYPYLETLIEAEYYHHFDGTGVTVCCLVLTNGYSVTADAVCANTQLFDLETGKQQARRNALKRLMELEHYLLRQRLFEAAAARKHEEHKP